MRATIAIITLLFLCAAMPDSMAAADKPAVPKTYAHRLSNKEVTELSELVCRRHGVTHDEINAWTNNPKDKNPHAAVICEPHATMADYAISYRAECRRENQWQCGRSETWLRTTLDSRPVDIATNGYKHDLAYSLVSKIARYRNIKGDLVFEPNTKQCSLSKGPSKELLDITCDGKLFRLSYWCPNSSCPRMFSINGYFVPADGGGL